MQNGLEGKYILKNNKKLAFGYTTGSCAAAAAKAAAIVLFTHQPVGMVELMTPKGILLKLKVEELVMAEDHVSCAIRKDAGDDPDVTDGVLVYAKVRKLDAKAGQKETEIAGIDGKQGDRRIQIKGGLGVGRITKPGLEQPVGEAAINRVPRQMISQAVLEICEEQDYPGYLEVEISIPAGVALAQKTFNPRLGICGGISVLGTSGIVEPMSEEALIASIRLELSMHRENQERTLLVAPGNYGTNYVKEHLFLDLEQAVKCSNFVGETIDMAVELGFERLLFVSHIGKAIKLAGGIMNTHSRNADARMELLAACGLRAGTENQVLCQVLDAVTTEDGLKLLQEAGVLTKTMEYMMEKIHFHLDRRAYGKLDIGIVVFSNELGQLGQAGSVEQLLKELQE